MFDSVDTDAVTDDVVRALRLLADPTRLRLLRLLQYKELNVSAICRRLELAQPTVSHHLGLLRSVGLVNNRRQGKQVFYRLNPEQVDRFDTPGSLLIQTGPVSVTLEVSGTPAAATRALEPQCA
ncbi:MAG: ArsR/SmtB family transcription factor [Planctomycetota bacterium]